jgi:hypothetical protein
MRLFLLLAVFPSAVMAFPGKLELGDCQDDCMEESNICAIFSRIKQDRACCESKCSSALDTFLNAHIKPSAIDPQAVKGYEGYGSSGFKECTTTCTNVNSINVYFGKRGALGYCEAFCSDQTVRTSGGGQPSSDGIRTIGKRVKEFLTRVIS